LSAAIPPDALRRRSAQSRPTGHQRGQILASRMVAELWLQVEVVGCPTVCRHCWAQGVPYPAMPVHDVAWVLEQARRFCDDHGLGFGAYPMHEVAAHPQATELLRLFADYVGGAEIEPLATTGVPPATSEDWQELLAAAASLGTTTVWVAFHGLGVEHDRQGNRPGAFSETCLAVQRAHAAGLRAGCNVFLTTANAGQAERLFGGGAAAGDRPDVVGAGDLLPDSPGPPQRAATPGAVGAAAVGRPDPHAEPIRPRRVGEPGGPYRGGLDASRAGRRLAVLDAPRRRGAGAGVPPQPRPTHRRGRLVPPTARQPAHRQPAGGARQRPRGRWSVLRGAVVRSRSAASVRFLWLDRAQPPRPAP
jgi:hypothetical protein